MTQRSGGNDNCSINATVDPGDFLEANPVARSEHGVDQHGAIIGKPKPK
jgi:hypothetical protein